MCGIKSFWTELDAAVDGAHAVDRWRKARLYPFGPMVRCPVSSGASSENNGYRNRLNNRKGAGLRALRTPLCTGPLSRPRSKHQPILLHVLESEGWCPEPDHCACPNRRWIFVDWLGTGLIPF